MAAKVGVGTSGELSRYNDNFRIPQNYGTPGATYLDLGLVF